MRISDWSSDVCSSDLRLHRMQTECAIEAVSPPLLAGREALFLDFDGTLTEIVARPELVYIEPALIRLIERTQRLIGGALAVIRGRPLKQIDRKRTRLKPSH